MTGPSVIGLDLSISATGVALPNGELDCWRLAPNLGDQRLLTIRERVRYITLAKPDLVVIEDLMVHGPGNGLAGGMVQGAVRSQLLADGVPYALVAPSTLKKYATGKGNATKPDMRMALFTRTGLDERDDNKVDAWFLRAMGLDHLGAPVLELPAMHRASLDKVQWPALVGA